MAPKVAKKIQASKRKRKTGQEHQGAPSVPPLIEGDQVLPTEDAGDQGGGDPAPVPPVIEGDHHDQDPSNAGDELGGPVNGGDHHHQAPTNEDETQLGGGVGGGGPSSSPAIEAVDEDEGSNAAAAAVQQDGSPEKKKRKKKIKTAVARASTSKNGVEKKTMKKKKKKKMDISYKKYIHKVLKQVHPQLTLSSKTATSLNQFVEDILGRVAREASQLVMKNNKVTLKVDDVKASVKLVMGGELAIHGIAEGLRAVAAYNESLR